MVDSRTLALHEAYERIEDQFNEMLDQSLDPRGPDVLYDIVAALGLEPGASAVDVGCGEGRHAIELATRFGLHVDGIDPIARRPDDHATTFSGSVRFATGTAEALPLDDASVDLVWCRDVLEMVDDLAPVYAEFARVLKPGGHALVYQMCTTDLLDPREAAWLHPTMGCVPASMQPEAAEAAIAAAGLRIEHCIILGTEWGEYGQEQTGRGAQKLLRAARLLRDPDRYIARFGRDNYDIALGDNLWHVYRLIGKLSDRVYLLSAPGA